MASNSRNSSAAKKRNPSGAKTVKGRSKNGNGSDDEVELQRNGADHAALEEIEQKRGKSKLQFESTLTRDEAAAYFEAIVRGLREGSIHFHQKEESLTLSPAEHLSIEVKAAQKGGREKLSFEVAWRTDKGSSLTIVPGDAPAADASPSAP